MVFDQRTPFFYFIVIFLFFYFLTFRRLKLQNFIVLCGSLIFYGWWDFYFLLLLMFSCSFDYLAGLLIVKYPTHKKHFLAGSVIINLTILGIFKYFNFFSENLVALLREVGIPAGGFYIDVVLPIGISFYTFQSIAYTFDVYRGEIEPERNPLTFLAYITYFPQLVAGPIERGHDLLPQFKKERVITVDGCREAVWLLSWGYFLKVVIADTAGTLVNTIFTPDQKSATLVVIGTLAFGVQIYADFNGYSLIARGFARLMGFNLVWNFKLPYFAANIREFWRRWHISLSFWLRDYLYVPLGGSRLGPRRTYVNLIATMLLGGLWHGAAWNFVFWGGLHGAALAINRAQDERRLGLGPIPTPISYILTMLVVFVGWFFFRSTDWPTLTAMVGALANPTWTDNDVRSALCLFCVAAPVVAMEAWQSHESDLLVALKIRPVAFAILTGLLVAGVAVMWGRFRNVFIYFQF